MAVFSASRSWQSASLALFSIVGDEAKWKYEQESMVIQYNLDSTCPDSTFYWLIRHSLLEHVSYFVTEIIHLVREIG